MLFRSWAALNPDMAVQQAEWFGGKAPKVDWQAIRQKASVEFFVTFLKYFLFYEPDTRFFVKLVFPPVLSLQLFSSLFYKLSTIKRDYCKCFFVFLILRIFFLLF